MCSTLVKSVFFITFLGIASSDVVPRAGCTVTIQEDLHDLQPLLLKPGTQNGNEAYYYPENGRGQIKFRENDTIVFACPGSSLKIKQTTINKSYASGRCSSGSFLLENSRVPLKSISCTKLPFHMARYTGKVCLGKYREAEIGFKISNSRFLRLVTLCFDDKRQTTLYSEFNMTQYIDSYQTSFPRPGFIQDNFFDVGGRSVDKMYTRGQQRKTINALVGLPASSTKYIEATSDFFLGRGHLTAKADFVYGAQQSATFHYINVAPQWHTFNGNNWNSLEQDVRNFVSNQQTDIIVYTGSYGVTTLPHETSGRDIELFIYVDGNRRGIPVPQLFWKVLYEPETKSGVAFVGVNNPYHKDVEAEVICDNICDQIKWLHWNTKNITYGYSYCCTVDDLRRTVKDIPYFPVTNLLH